MQTKKNVQVSIFCSYSLGLENDANILRNLLVSKFACSEPIIFKGSDKKSVKITKIFHILLKKIIGRDIVVFHIEDIQSFILWITKRNYIIPNQEWFRSQSEAHIASNKNIKILCKTKHAIEAFSDFKERTYFIGSISPNRYVEGVQKDFGQYLHLAGKSEKKGTLELIDSWAKHPEWPRLTLITKVEEHIASATDVSNISIISDHLSDYDLAVLMNSHGIHICPSEIEGFGAHIVEALSTGAIVLTTDAPPMNELITPNCGILLDCEQTYKQYRGIGFHVKTPALITAIQGTFDLSNQQLSDLSQKSRNRYSELKRNYEKCAGDIIGEILNGNL